MKANKLTSWVTITIALATLGVSRPNANAEPGAGTTYPYPYSASDPEPTSLPEQNSELVVGFQAAWVWFGLTPGGKLLRVQGNPNKPEYIKCFERIATKSERDYITQIIKDQKMMEVPRNLPEIDKDPNSPPSLTRISLWKDGNKNETSTGRYTSAPENVKNFSTSLEKLCETSPKTAPQGVVFSIDLERKLEPENKTYAETITENGREIKSWNANDIPPTILAVCRHAESAEALSPKDVDWFKSKLAPGETALLMRIDNRAVQLVLLSPPGSVHTSQGP